MDIRGLIIKCSVVVVFLSLIVLSGIWAWTEPTTNPPAGNIDVPVHSGTSSQFKWGNLYLNYGGSWPYGLVVLGKTMVGGDIEPADTGINLGTATTPWDNIYANTIYFDKGWFNTLDPTYKINDKKYSTYVTDMVGLKAEAVGEGQLQNGKLVIDLANQSEESDLWLFWNIVKHDSIIPFVSPQSDAIIFGYIKDTNFIIESREKDSSAAFSYRLIGERVDNTAVNNICTDQNIKTYVDVDAIKNK